MSDFTSLIRNLHTRLGDIRREMKPQDWAAFKNLLAEAAPFFEQAAADPDARLEAIFRLKRACLRFPQTRGVIPPPAGMIPAAKPETPPDQPVSGLSGEPLAQRMLAIALQLCHDPDAVADDAGPEAEAPPDDNADGA